MRRRVFLPLSAAAMAAQSKRPGFQLSVRVEALMPGLSLDFQLEKVAEAGYSGFEFGDWRVPDAVEINKRKRRLGLECVCIVGNKGVNPVGMGLCNPAERDGFLAEIKASAEAAARFETSKLVVLSGFKVPGQPRAPQHASIVEGLKRAHDIVAPRGITMIMEVVNTLAPVEPLNPKGNNHHDYYLDRTPEAFQIVKEVGSPFLKILYDFYHTQIMEGNLIETVRGNIGDIGHFHIGEVPGRHEPGTGEINHPRIYEAIRSTGYTGYVGMEYVPTKDVVTSLRESREMAML